MALETLNNRYGIRHFEDGGSTGDPLGTVTVSGAPNDAYNIASPNFDVNAYLLAAAAPSAPANAGGLNAAPAGGAAPSGSTDISSPDFSPQAYLGAAYTPPPVVTAADIAGLYTSELNRPLDQPGLDFWLGQAKQGASLDAIRQAFRDSQEFKALPTTTTPPVQTGLNAIPGSTQEVTNWFKTNLFRDPTQSEIDSYSRAFGSALDPTELALLNQTPEAQNRKAIDTAYQSGLGRVGTPDEYNTWMQAIAGGKSLADVQRDIANSTEGRLYSAYMAEMGRKPDPEGFKYFSDRLAQGATIDQIRQEMSASEEGKKYDVNSLYKETLFRDAKPEELTAITDLLNQGHTLDFLRKRAYDAPEVIVTQDYMKYIGRVPEAAGLKFWQDQLAAGKTKEQIAQGIALSNESINANTASVKAVLEATLGKDVVDNITPSQLAAYTRTILDPMRVGAPTKATQDQFDRNYYLTKYPDVAASGMDPYQHYANFGFNEGRSANANAPTYASQADNLKEVYRQIALDPIMGAKLKETDRKLYESVTPIDPSKRGNYITSPFKTPGTGDWGSIKVNGVDVPILNGKTVSQYIAPGEKLQDFSHGRNLGIYHDIGWNLGGFSSTIARGAAAVGVEKYEDENYGRTYTGLNEAARLFNIDPSKFQDKQVQEVTKDAYDESGQLIQKGGQPAFRTDETTGERIPVMKTVTAQDQLYDAINEASKDIYQVTGPNLQFSHAQQTERNPNAFQTVLYQQTGEKLIPVSAPQTHGGMYNLDVYTGGGKGFLIDSGMLQGITFVGSAALAMMTLGASTAATAPATMLGTALGAGATAAPIVGSIVIGAAMGALSSAAAGQDFGKGAITGAVTGGITSSMAPLLQTGAIGDSIKAAADASNGLYTQNQIATIVSASLANALGTASSGASGDRILKSFGTALAANGISQASVTGITTGLKDVLQPDTIAKIARASQIVSNTVATSALSGKNPQQIVQSLITQFSNPTSAISTIGSIANAKGTPPEITPTNPFGTENVGFTSGSVDAVLQSQIMDGIANNSEDPIAFMNAAKNWTGDGKDNVAFVTTEMVRQGMPADEISADLQELYRIPASKADEYAKYMVAKGATTSAPIIKASTTTTTQEPTNVVAQTSVPTPQPDMYNTLVDLFSNPTEYVGPTYANLAQAAPAVRFDVGTSAPLVSVGAAQSNLGGANPANDPTSYRTYSPRPSGDEYSNVYPSLTGRGAQDPNYIRELVAAYKADPSYEPIREELQKLDPGNPVFASAQSAAPVRTETPATSRVTAPSVGKVTVTGYPELSALPKPVETPSPMLPEPMPAVPSPNKPANDPYTIPEPRVPGVPLTPIVPVSPPGPTPRVNPIIAPGSIPLTDPNKLPVPEIRPTAPPTEQPSSPTAPVKPTGPVQEPVGEPKTAPTPEQQSVIQQVARTPQEAQRLELAVPKATQLITSGVPRTVAIPKVADEFKVPVQDLATVIDSTVPDITPVTTPAPTVPTPTTTTPAPRTPTRAPTTTARKAGTISPFLISQYGGIQDLSPGLTEGANYSLSGIPSTELNMNPMTPYSPLQQFAATSPASPIELGAQQQPNEPIGMATGGTPTANAVKPYNPYDVSSGISGSLTPGLTKARLDYVLTGLPQIQTHAEGGAIGHNPQFFSEGGLGSMDNTFVKGDGDGTSDSVPAMLANGEFVIPADVVSGLGNGSNDAGAQVLQEFLKVIREHKHSAKSNKLPPKSKGPLAYLTNAKRKVKVA